MSRCPDDEKIDLYLKGKLSQTDSAEVEEHYFSCDACFQRTSERAAIIDVIRTRGASIFASGIAEPRPSTPVWGRAAAFGRRSGLAAAVGAALLVIVVAVILPRLKSRAPEFTLSADETVRGESLALLAPLGAAKAAPDVFAWRSVPAAAEYRLTLWSGSKAVWTTATLGTQISLPSEIRAVLRAAVRYSWQVKAFSAQGSLLAVSPKEAFEFSD